MSELKDLLARIEALEVRAVYQDQTIEDLNETVTRQWAELDKVQRDLARMHAQMAEIDGFGGGETNERPPHY